MRSLYETAAFGGKFRSSLFRHRGRGDVTCFCRRTRKTERSFRIRPSSKPITHTARKPGHIGGKRMTGSKWGAKGLTGRGIGLLCCLHIPRSRICSYAGVVRESNTECGSKGCPLYYARRILLYRRAGVHIEKQAARRGLDVVVVVVAGIGRKCAAGCPGRAGTLSFN